MSSAGSFATARRGAVLQSEVHQAQLRLGSRATPAQLAKMLGRCEADVRTILEGQSLESIVTVREPDPAPVFPRGYTSPAEDKALIALWNAGHPSRLIAARLGKSDHCIRQRAKHLGLQPRPSGRKPPVLDWTPAMDEVLVREYVVGGKAARTVAGMIPGATKAAVISRAWRLGMLRHSPAGVERRGVAA